MVYTYIWGAGELGKQCLRRIRGNVAEQTIYYFCDNNTAKIGYEIDDVPIISMENLKENVKNHSPYLILVAVRQLECDKVVKQLKENGINRNIYVYSDILHFTAELERIYGKPNLSYVETHVNDHCNLRCKGCGHLSNIAPLKFTEFSIFEKDMKRLGELFQNIDKIRLMGGEPFLNNDIYKFAASAREIFQRSDIRIVTNGLLLNESKADLLSRLKNLDIMLDITNYPPTQKALGRIENVLMQSGIKYRITEKVKEFTKFRNLKADMDINRAYMQCTIKECHYLREGKLSICTFPILYQELDTFMKEKFKMNERDVINIYDVSINGWDIVLRLSAPIDACRYCYTDRIEAFNWEGFSEKSASIEDWCVEG